MNYLIECKRSLNDYSRICRLAADRWYHDPETGEPITRNIGEQIALIHSEVSEAMEGFRKNLMDNHLPHRLMAEVELADALIRIFDLAGEQGFDLEGALREKLAYNRTRADHTDEARRNKEGGKQW